MTGQPNSGIQRSGRERKGKEREGAGEGRDHGSLRTIALGGRCMHLEGGEGGKLRWYTGPLVGAWALGLFIKIREPPRSHVHSARGAWWFGVPLDRDGQGLSILPSRGRAFAPLFPRRHHLNFGGCVWPWPPLGVVGRALRPLWPLAALMALRVAHAVWVWPWRF